MECPIFYKDEDYQNTGRTCKICELKSYYIVLNYLPIIFILVTVYCCYISIYRFIIVYFSRQPIVVLLASFTVSTTSCLHIVLHIIRVCLSRCLSLLNFTHKIN